MVLIHSWQHIALSVFSSPRRVSQILGGTAAGVWTKWLFSVQNL